MARPLRKVSKKGQIYTRSADIEANIDRALAEGLPELKRNLEVTDKNTPGYLTSECLVHLIREAQMTKDRNKGNLVVPVLLARCEAILNSKIDASTIPNAEVLREEILCEFAVMLANDGTGDDANELDIYECVFNLAFRALRIDMIRREHEHSTRFTKLRVRPSDYDEDGAEVLGDSEGPGSVPSYIEGLYVNDLLNTLPDNERKAFILHYMMGYEIESTKEDESTVATICGVSGRTIGNWLRKAKSTLEKSMKEKV